MAMISSLQGANERDRLVTGSSGFIGSHLCRALSNEHTNWGKLTGIDRNPAPPDASWSTVLSDLTEADAPNQLRRLRPSAVVHLAALVESIVPFDAIGNLVSLNVSMMLTVLQSITQARFLHASSAAVYGNAHGTLKAADWASVNPESIYGMSKAFGELACRDWAQAKGGTAISFRFGNVVGAGCRGIIPFLVAHGLKHPDGSVAAQCRGKGQIVRDYVPVSFVVRALRAGLEMECPSGSHRTFNVGTGRVTTNGDVGRIVQSVLSGYSVDLQINWNNPLMAGESGEIILDMTESVRQLSLEIPPHEETVQAIVESVDYIMASASLPRKEVSHRLMREAGERLG